MDMDMDMNEYDPDALCPKCAFDLVSTRYCQGAPFVRHEFAGYGMAKLELRCPGTEHLERVCCRCGYGWLERCVAPPPLPQSPAIRAAAGV